jgi:crossover junction endodeoxyribonuclease RuvC
MTQLQGAEVVDRDHSHCQGALVAPGALDFLGQTASERARAQQTRHRIQQQAARALGFQLGYARAKRADFGQKWLILSLSEHAFDVSASARNALSGDVRPAGRSEGVRAPAQNLEGMVILGIDPGTASTGYGVVESAGPKLRARGHGVIETQSASSLELRLAEIHHRVSELLERHRPAAVAIEQLYFGANVRTALAVGQARGVALLAAGQRGVPSRSYTPQQVKAAVCGHGRAAKPQVAQMAARLLGLDASSLIDHAADALAVAICDLNRAPLAAALGAA